MPVSIDPEKKPKEPEQPSDDETPETEEETQPRRTSGFDASEFIAGMMSDPEIQAVIAARREGRDVQVTDRKPKEPEPPQRKKLSEEIGDDDEVDPTIKRVLDLIEQRVDSTVAPLSEKLAGLEEMASGFQRQTVNQQIEKAAAKYNDFDKYRGEMAKIARETPGLSMDELYLIAKSRANDLNFAQPSTETERPMAATGVRRGLPKKPKYERGRKGWNDMLADSLEKLPSRQE
jgi:hypothetical protein